MVESLLLSGKCWKIEIFQIEACYNHLSHFNRKHHQIVAFPIASQQLNIFVSRLAIEAVFARADSSLFQLTIPLCHFSFSTIKRYWLKSASLPYWHFFNACWHRKPTFPSLYVWRCRQAPWRVYQHELSTSKSVQFSSFCSFPGANAPFFPSPVSLTAPAFTSFLPLVRVLVLSRPKCYQLCCSYGKL